MKPDPVRRAAALATLLLCATASVGAAGLHPEAPPETAQFAFLVGRWDCTITSRQPDGSVQEGKATWTGSYILGGWAIQDLWEAQLPDGDVFRGVNIRSFNPQTKRWDNRWLASGSLQWKYFSAEKVGETMVMTGGEGTDPVGAYVDRNVFSDIAEMSFRWRKDRSYDGGETWIEGVARIVARRAD